MRALLAPSLRLGAGGLGLAAGVLASGPAAAQAPDLVVGDVTQVATLGSAGGRAAYAAAVTACNLGGAPADWDAATDRHPVFVAALYRHHQGRFEQVGRSWAFHEFGALNTAACATCTPPGGPNLLGAGCSTTHSATVAGAQSFLGARSDVDPASGAFPMPFTGQGQGGTVLDKRLQVELADLDPAAHPGARYFLEVQYVAADDAAAGSGANNASHREVLVGPGLVPPLSPTGSTAVGSPALAAWAGLDPGVLIDAVVDDGRFLLGSRATDNGDGTWHYEYALFNQDSARGAGSFAVALPLGATVTHVGFHDVDPHSGEVWDGADWTATVAPHGITWSTTPHAQDPLASALRWGSLVNLRFDCDVPPASGPVAVGLFAPGVTPTLTPEALVPDLGDEPGVVTCAPNGVHSGGTSGRLTVEGSTLVAANDLSLTARDLPANVFGYLLVSATPGLVTNPGGAQGDLCLGGVVGRYAARVQSSGPAGAFTVPVDLGQLPAPLAQPVLAGQTWIFQAWFRDANPGPTSNFTSAQALTFL